MDMAADAGATIIEIGHSEIRRDRGETDEIVRWKVRAALDAGLRPLVCVGEPSREREWGSHVEFIRRQVRIALGGVPESALGRVLIAYEPEWAIGIGGTPATSEQVSAMHGHIRATLDLLFGPAGQAVSVLYGGNVTPQNAATLWHTPGVDGLFVGRAALDPEQFLAIAESIQPAATGA